MAEGKESSEIEAKPGQAVLDLRPGSKKVIWVGSHIVIDAMPQIGRPGFPKTWVDPEQARRYGAVVGRVRQITTSAMEYQDIFPGDLQVLSRLALIDELRKQGIGEVQSSRIVGKVPVHWNPQDRLARKFLLPREQWEREKELLRQSK